MHRLKNPQSFPFSIKKIKNLIQSPPKKGGGTGREEGREGGEGGAESIYQTEVRGGEEGSLQGSIYKSL